MDKDKNFSVTIEMEYINTLSEYEKVIYELAKNHLATSFDLEKSVGFLDFCKEKNSGNTK
tara:strand:+ start:245 stop:424 length:180 start_codon:yes stop_codon:yes gene_type:complete